MLHPLRLLLALAVISAAGPALADDVPFPLPPRKTDEPAKETRAERRARREKTRAEKPPEQKPDPAPQPQAQSKPPPEPKEKTPTEKSEENDLLVKDAGVSSVTGNVYLFRAADEVEVVVLGREDLSRTVQIREDGTFSFPLIGSVEAAGRSASDIESEVQRRLADSLPAIKQVEAPDASAVVKPEEAQQAQFYRLQIGDELDIQVWGQTDLNTKAQIREDGTFSFPLIGSVKGAGRSIQDVEKEVRERLDKDFIVNPQVTVQLTGAKFTVLGEVENPGPYTYVGNVDLLSAISEAGGLTEKGSGKVDVIRVGANGKMSIRFNLDSVLGGLEPNLPILPRDAIMIYPQLDSRLGVEVMVRLSGAKFTVLGEVERPGSYPMESTVDVLTAISQAGGLTKFGSNKLEIIRTRGGEKTRIRVNLDRVIQGDDPNIPLMPHDTVYVKRRLF